VDHLRRLGGNSALLSGPLAVDSDSRFESLCAARDVDAEVAAVLTDLIAVALGDTHVQNCFSPFHVIWNSGDRKF